MIRSFTLLLIGCIFTVLALLFIHYPRLQVTISPTLEAAAKRIIQENSHAPTR